MSVSGTQTCLSTFMVPKLDIASPVRARLPALDITIASCTLCRCRAVSQSYNLCSIDNAGARVRRMADHGYELTRSGQRAESLHSLAGSAGF